MGVDWIACYLQHNRLSRKGAFTNLRHSQIVFNIICMRVAPFRKARTVPYITHIKKALSDTYMTGIVEAHRRVYTQ